MQATSCCDVQRQSDVDLLYVTISSAGQSFDIRMIYIDLQETIVSTKTFFHKQLGARVG